jgi:hypothetical protein
MENRRTSILALVAITLTLGLLWQVNRPEVVQEATPAQVRAEAARGGYRLIDTAALAKLYQQPPANFLLVDTRQDWEYRSGHLQAAVNFPIDPTWWGRFRAQGRLAALLGPDQDRLVVFY